MGDLGAISLWIGLALAAYASIASFAGKLRGSAALVDSGQAAVYAAMVAVLVATLSLVTAFIARDFELAYVAAHSDWPCPTAIPGWRSTPATRGRCSTSPPPCP